MFGKDFMLVPIVTRNIIFLSEFSGQLEPIKRGRVSTISKMYFRK
jgi:hypothetical protein